MPERRPRQPMKGRRQMDGESSGRNWGWTAKGSPSPGADGERRAESATQYSSVTDRRTDASALAKTRLALRAVARNCSEVMTM